MQTWRQGLDLALCDSLRRASQVSTLSREQIAAELTKRVGRKISAYMLDAWTADTKQAWHLPADVVPALCEILQDDAIQRQLLSPELLQYLELGESAERSRAVQKEIMSDAEARVRMAGAHRDREIRRKSNRTGTA